MNIDTLYRTFWPIGQRAIGVNETQVLVEMTEWHTYVIEWQEKTAHFIVDGNVVLSCNTPPKGPLGFVLWLDNQYMVVTPWGKFGYGLLDSPGEQWMEISELRIENCEL